MAASTPSSASSYSYRTEAEALDAIKRLGGDELMRCEDSVRASKRVCLEAVKSTVDALLWAGPDLKEDKEVVLAAVRAHGRALRYTKGLREDRECCMAAVENTGSALQFCSRPLRGDREVVLLALQSAPTALQYASEDLRADASIVAVAAKQDRRVLVCAPEATQREVKRSLDESDSRFQTTYTSSF